MIQDVITPYTKPQEWPTIRQKILSRIHKTLGDIPTYVFDKKWVLRKQREQYGLTIIDFTYEFLPNYICEGSIVLPDSNHQKNSHPGVVCIHGTDTENAHFNVIDPDKNPKRAYGIELAKRGFVSIAVNLFGFGKWPQGTSLEECEVAFYREFPNWSLDGIRNYGLKCAVDILSDYPLVDKEKISCIGHSLGGRHSLFLAATDERIKTAIVSTGVSPNTSNVYRNLQEDTPLCPLVNKKNLADGIPPWEYQELLALVAPRALVTLEPFNDPWNPFIEPVMDCFLKARKVWSLLQCEDKLLTLCHGLGHDTPDDLRLFAYNFIEKNM